MCYIYEIHIIGQISRKTETQSHKSKADSCHDGWVANNTINPMIYFINDKKNSNYNQKVSFTAKDDSYALYNYAKSSTINCKRGFYLFVKLVNKVNALC